MALGSILGAAAAGFASAGASKLASGLFGGKKSQQTIDNLSSARVPGFTGGGLSATFNPDGSTFTVSSNGARQGIVGNIARTFPEQAAALRQLRGQVTPGFGRLTESRVAAIDAARRRGVGNLRENLARRRILGSSFASDAMTRAEAEFALEEANVRAQSFLEELQLTNNLVGQEFEAQRGEFKTLLDELNIQSDIGLKLATGAAAQVGANQRQAALLAAQDLQGAGKFLEPAISKFGDAVGKGVSGLFGGGKTAVDLMPLNI